jgi:hypothetical protein
MGALPSKCSGLLNGRFPNPTVQKLSGSKPPKVGVQLATMIFTAGP